MKNFTLILTTAFLVMCGITNAQKAAVNSPAALVDPITKCAYRYFYYPNIEAYYDKKKNVYLYSDKGEWKAAAEIPSGYRGYSLNNKINVVIDDYDDDDPIQFIKLHKKKYPYNFRGKSREVATAMKH